MDCKGMWDLYGVFLLSIFGLCVGDDLAWSSSMYLALGGKRGRYRCSDNTDSLMVGAILGYIYRRLKCGFVENVCMYQE